MHKYWGKKPSNDLKSLIEKYSEEGDTVLDPFSGYGVFCCEAFILNRNIISNDLNPIAHFLNEQLLEKKVDLSLVQNQWKKIKSEFEPYNKKWFEWEINDTSIQLITVLRDKNNIPIKAKYKGSGDKKAIEIKLSVKQVETYLAYEKTYKVQDWYPTKQLIQNSRISAKKGMTVSNLFTVRTLACHARLLKLIEKYSAGAEQKLFKVAFTANLANCSRSETIDYVFTDPPYGDAVPYFEQSVIWNSWLKLLPDYENEIVVSDSKERTKNTSFFERDINSAFSEIRRVLKPNKHFSLTYHSLSGLEWKAITNACIKNGFELVDFKWLVQKSFTPRQINRLKSIKGDVLVTFKKSRLPKETTIKSNKEVSEKFISNIKKWLSTEPLDTNEIFLRIMNLGFN